MPRSDGRTPDALRPLKATPGFVSLAEGSVLIEVGRTRVLCNATVEEKLPPWLREGKRGWVTAEYSLLPRSTGVRTKRERQSVSGRTHEIQRLIGRALRGVCDLHKLGERQILVDCDVIEADGGTRTASVVGGFLALALAIRSLQKRGVAPAGVLKDWLAAVSVGICKGEPLLDLAYDEDVAAEVDMNVIMTGKGEFVEVQGTGEKSVFSRDQLGQLLDLAAGGCATLVALEKEVLGDALP